jgi:hypothetical protein
MRTLRSRSFITIGLPPAKVKALAVASQLSFTQRKGPNTWPASKQNKNPKLKAKIKRQERKLMSTVKKTLLLATPVVLLCGWFAYDSVVTNLKFIPTTEEERAAIRAEVAAQDENAFYKPARGSRSLQQANPLNNVYFGDLHIHSNLSADAYLFGNRRDLDATYRFAKGESAPIETGEILEITQPQD